ncbi:MAG: M50 family metallopeptidase [Nanoarchaeota archaeon]
MNTDYVLLGLFVALMLLFLLKNKKKVQMQKMLFPLLYFVMYRTKLGLKWMDNMAKRFPKSLHYFYSVGVYICFLGMAFICWQIIKLSIDLILKPSMPPAIQLVLPIEAKGIFYIPFSYWIISIFIIAVVHEFSHGVASRIYNIPVKSSGFAFLGIILPVVPAAFVEPDEKKLLKQSWKKQIAVFAAGPLANIALAFLLIIGSFALNPLMGVFFEKGISLASVEENGPAFTAGIRAGEVITGLNNEKVNSLREFRTLSAKFKEGEEVLVKTLKQEYKVKLAKKDNKVIFGFSISNVPAFNTSLVEKIGSWAPASFLWLLKLYELLIMLNLGIGLFNLLPIGPVDGGRMFSALIGRVIPTHSKKICSCVTSFFLVILIVHVVKAFV